MGAVHARRCPVRCARRQPRPRSPHGIARAPQGAAAAATVRGLGEGLGGARRGLTPVRRSARGGRVGQLAGAGHGIARRQRRRRARRWGAKLISWHLPTRLPSAAAACDPPSLPAVSCGSSWPSATFPNLAVARWWCPWRRRRSTPRISACCWARSLLARSARTDRTSWARFRPPCYRCIATGSTSRSPSATRGPAPWSPRAPEAEALIGRRVALFGGLMWADYRIADKAAVGELPDDVSSPRRGAVRQPAHRHSRYRLLAHVISRKVRTDLGRRRIPPHERAGPPRRRGDRPDSRARPRRGQDDVRFELRTDDRAGRRPEPRGHGRLRGPQHRGKYLIDPQATVRPDGLLLDGCAIGEVVGTVVGPLCHRVGAALGGQQATDECSDDRAQGRAPCGHAAEVTLGGSGPSAENAGAG